MQTIAVTPTYAAILALLFVVITLRIVRTRFSARVSLGDGGDKHLTKLIRGHGNFTETVPLALLLMLMLELKGAPAALLHPLGILLLGGRISHYLQVTGIIKPLMFRTAGMVLTLGVIITAAIRLLFYF